MADSGGSNRILRDEFGILPTSDIRQCIVALASQDGNQETLRQLFTYRFHQGRGIAGMTFGNLFMAALTDIYKDQLKAIQKTCEILQVKGEILPVTLDDVQLVARYDNGHQVVGEHWIDEPRHDKGLRIVELTTIPRANVFQEAKKAIKEADLVVIGPGDLYTSLICNLVIKGVPEAIAKSKGKVVYVLNLMSRQGQTPNYTAKDHVREIEKYFGKRKLNYVLVNENTNYQKEVLFRYKQEKAFPVDDNLGMGNGYQVIREDLFSPSLHQKAKGDNLRRSIIRHDPHKLASALLRLV
jgi:uncharacterized cofD-like protein